MRMKALMATAEMTTDDADADVATMVPQQFEVRDRDAAEWLVRKLVEAESHIARVKVQAEREIRRTQQERDFLLLRYGSQLERWTREQLEENKGRRKSVLLLSGTVGFRNISAKLVVDNAAAVLKWAKRNCANAVVVVEKISKSTLDEHLKSTGEVPQGAHLEAMRQKFFVK